MATKVNPIFRSEPQECIICLEGSQFICQCSACQQSWCDRCDQNLGSCPFCRAIISGRETRESILRMQREQAFFNSFESLESHGPSRPPPPIPVFISTHVRRRIYRAPRMPFRDPPPQRPTPPFPSKLNCFFFTMFAVFLLFGIWMLSTSSQFSQPAPISSQAPRDSSASYFEKIFSSHDHQDEDEFIILYH